MVEYEVADGPSVLQSDLEAFVRLVRTGGAVNVNYVRQGIRRDGAKLVLARIDNEIIGVAALKIPAATYRDGIAGTGKSGHPLPTDQFPFELGYVSVTPTCRGRGIAQTLIGKVIELSDGQGLFATTSNVAMRMALLPSAGFERVGHSWLNEENEQLHLYTLRK